MSGRVLVADDDPLVRKLLRQALAAARYDVVAAADGGEAIAHLDRSGPFQVVVTDYSMPAYDGMAVIRHAQVLDPTLPCVIVTAYRDLDLAMKGMQAGAVGFIPKPFKVEHLLTVVERALERRRLAEETVRLRILTPMLERFTMVLANTLETKDLATRLHSERLVDMADATAAELALEADARRGIRLGAALHDIGKVGIPEHVLRKPQRLTEEEFALIRSHPEIGAAILEDVDTWHGVREIVRHHHERFDGSGYPAGLAAGGIPIGARIVAVVDACDVMLRGRPYSPARGLDEVIAELRSESGHQFDPDVVSAFLGTITVSSAGSLSSAEPRRE